jgi:hypothetical protein
MSYLFIPRTSLKAYLLLVKSAAELFVNRLGAIGTVLGFVIDILNIASKCAGSDFVAVLEAYIFPTLALLAIMAFLPLLGAIFVGVFATLLMGTYRDFLITYRCGTT